MPDHDSKSAASIRAASMTMKNQEWPRAIQIETTTRCPATCSFCPQHDTGRASDVMPWDLFEKILGDAREWQGLVYRLYLLNEPLTDPLLAERIATISGQQLRPHVELHSNGLMLNKQLALDLIDSGLNVIRFSVDGFYAATLKRTRGLSKERVYDNILRFIHLNELAGHPVNVIVRMIRQLADGSDELKQFSRFWKDRADEVVFTDLYSWPPHDIKEPVSAPCPKPQEEMFVRADGSVILCCWDWMGLSHIGNVRTDNLASLWTRLALARQWLRQGRRARLQPCKSCNAFVGHFNETE